MKVTIDISRQEIIHDVISRSHEECKAITGIEARYNAEAGTDRLELINRLFADVDSSLRSVCSRFLAEDYTKTATDIPDSGKADTLPYIFDLSPRRADGKAQLAELIHSYLVDSILGRFYVAVGQGEFAANHAKLGGEKAQEILSYLYTKQAPIL